MFTKRQLALFASATILLSSSLGFGGGILGSKYFAVVPAATAQSTLNTKNQADAAAQDLIADPATQSAFNQAAAANPAAPTSEPRSGQLSVAEIAAIAAPSVVEIRTEVTVSGLRSRSYVAEGAGSGVLVTADGEIVTNNHVIDGAQTITVYLQNGQSYPATLVATDPETDIALIKIEASGLIAATLGDSDQLQVGDLAVAIGNPLGELGGTVTDGIISALDREITLDNETMNLMQTNAAINPGNSGGGLFDEAGNLIGIVVAKSSGTGVEGLGFAIPINDVKTVMNDLTRFGTVQGRIKLGVTLVDINTDDLLALYRVTEQGVYILKVDESGNAARAGLQSGDRIVAINGQVVSASAEIGRFLKTIEPGSQINIEVIRENRSLTISVEMQASGPQV